MRSKAHNSISIMARLVVQPGSPAAWEIQLKAGTNSFGRGPANDVTLDDPSVSGSHCQIVMDKGKAVIIDLGSTNGTYVNRTRVREAALQAGQTIHLGGLEMMFHPDAPASAGAAQAAPAASPLPPPRAAGPPRAVRTGPAATVTLAAPPVAVGTGRQAPIAAPPVTAEPTAAVGSGLCKYHSRTPGRFFCSHCQLFFCELCVTTRGHRKFCRTCGNVAESDECRICRDPRRDPSLICVVEEPKDVAAIEKIREFRGRYHVLGGAISPIDGVGPDDLRIKELMVRLADGTITELILATDPNLEGEATATYLARLIKPVGVRVTRPASGLPVGGELEYADEVTLGRAFEGRRLLDV